MTRKLTSRKFWAFIVALVSALGGLMTGDLSMPQFIQAVLIAVATYQVAEGVADLGRRR
jgi:hypothetical protein